MHPFESEIRDIRYSGAAVQETSYYGPLAAVLNEAGKGLRPEIGELEVTAGRGIAGRGGITMPGKGRARERDYTPEERAAITAGAALGLAPDEAFRHLGESCFDGYLNERAYWRCVPAGVWHYTLGGYQVIKKWLSYRERPLLGRALKPEEAREVQGIARRIAAILLLEPALDARQRRTDGSAATQFETCLLRGGNTREESRGPSA